MNKNNYRSWNVEQKIMHNTAMLSWNGTHEVWENNVPQSTIIWLTNGPDMEGKLMQFTSKYDKEGAAVYESDIIKNIDTGSLQIVYWNEEKAAWYCQYVNDENRITPLCESIGNLNTVIGNIYQNPELLNK